jgi:hypothetical protein
VAATTLAGDYFRLYPVDGGKPQAVRGLDPADTPIRFSADGEALFALQWTDSAPPGGRLFRIDLATGRRTPFLELTLPDLQGAFMWPELDVSPDGRSYLYSFNRIQSELYVIDGLR